MCTLAVAFQSDRRWPLVVAANRDERLGRPAEGWALREASNRTRYAAPRDLVAGGTWIGISTRAVFAAVTNFHLPAGGPPDASRRSRGELVGLALAEPSAAAALEAMRRLDAARYNPFHLLVADRDAAFLWRYDGGSAAVDPLSPGLHVVTENAPDGRCPRGELVRARWPLDSSPAALRDLLAIHAPSRANATCIHLDPAYGTRSSTVLRVAASVEHSDLYASDGPPCTSPLEDRSTLLAALWRSP